MNWVLKIMQCVKIKNSTLLLSTRDKENKKDAHLTSIEQNI